MGLLAPLAEMFFIENAYRPFRGNVLFIGRQDIFITIGALIRLFEKYKINAMPKAGLEFNPSNPHLILDKSFMSLFEISSLDFMDVSDYEGANIIWDLGKPVPEALHGRYDLIYNGSCLDNMFNPAQAILNLTNMLKPNGRIIHLEHASNFNGPYLMYSPGWFFDYYVQNGFADCKVYLAEFKDSPTLYFGPWDLFLYDWNKNPAGHMPTCQNNSHFMLVVIAEKKADASVNKLPIQLQYRKDEMTMLEFKRNLIQILTAERPIVNMTVKRNPQREEFIRLGMLSSDLYNGVYPPL
ncbi:MAG: hypothetical protein M0036_16590 [Desulfobacteraceae bacterium]|nr:hypothetical protein [Desulfobacteraceae bacterium]